MSPVGSVTPALNPAALAPGDVAKARPAAAPAFIPGAAGLGSAAPADGFGRMLDGLVETVATKQAHAGELTRRVLLGDSDQLHQSVIAMQEASVAFTLMVEVRNKLVESYQELMRMQV
jgi:flagellar hook-basal body complex protein FliE